MSSETWLLVLGLVVFIQVVSLFAVLRLFRICASVERIEKLLAEKVRRGQ